METTGINKTVYRSDVISALDSFTSVRNVLAWEMFQDGQVRNYDGVINDLQRLYPNIDFDSVTENVDPEGIAADENAIYALVDSIINKLIESGISKDNFNYAIWACDDPENVADTYGVDIDDVSAYKITDGILLQDLGYEGQLYGVAEYPEEEWDVIESALKGGDMKTREDYKDYYLEQLTEQFGDMTEADYNSAQKFCYDEEWNLGEVGNMAEAIDGLGDAWTEYQKQYKEGFKIMNNVTLSKKNITSSGRWVVKTNEDQMDYIGNFFEGLPSCPQYVDWGYDEEKYAKAVNDDIFGWMYEDSDFSEADKKKITRNFLKLYKDYYNNGEPKDDLNTYYFEGEGPKDPRLIEWLHSVLSDKELNVPFTTWHYVESSKRNIKSSKAEELEMFENESVYGNESEFNDFKKNHPDFTITYLDWKKYLNGYEDDVEYEYEDENGNMYTWDMIKTEIDNWVDSGDFEEQNGELPEYFEKDGTPKYKKIYDDFWDISSNGAFSEINSSRRNNMIKSSVLSQSEREGMEVVLGIICGYYGADDDDKRYEIVKEQLSPEELNQLDEICTYVLADEQGHKTVSDRVLKDDIPLLRKVYNIIDNNDLFKDSQGDYDWDAMSGFEKICLTSSKGEKKMKVIKSASGAGGNWEYQGYDMDEVEEKIGDIGISFTEPLLLADDGTVYTRAGFDQWLKYLEKEEGDNWPDAYEIYHRDTDEEFIEMCQDDFFQHDFGHTLTIYPEGLKSIAESVAEEIPSNEVPFAIPSGFAFNLYGEEEEPSGFNSYWIDDMSLDSESFIWGINPKLGNRFDVAINPDYLWNGTENIQSSKKGEKKMKIQSKRLIKSGTSNFGSNDDVFGYSFPLVTYIAENYMYDEETDSETEERDYDADSWEYEDAIDNAKALADEMDIPQYDDYSEPYLCHEPFMIKFRDGYYEGVWIEVKEGTDEEDIYNTNEYGSYYDGGRPFTDEEMNKFADKLNEYFNKLCSDYGWQKLGVTARFSNGETMYHKIDNSRKPIQSANYDGIKKQMQYTLDVLKEDAEDSDEEYAERVGYDGTDAGAVRYAINRFKDEYGIRNRYNVVNQSELADWLAGLPLSFDYANYNILQKGVEWGYLPPIQEGTDLTRKEANWLDNWWNGLANNILKLARKYNVGITSSRKPVTSGLTFRQAVQDFKAAGQWNDYYEMQQDWESYKDGLERDGLISEKTRSTWGNPCTPETFKRWNK